MMHVLAHPQGMVHATQKRNALTRMEQMQDLVLRLVTLLKYREFLFSNLVLVYSSLSFRF